jgi:hypothetical protein
MRTIVLSMALLGLGAAGGYLFGSLRAQPPLSALVVPERAERAPSVVADRGLSEAELRRVVHEELAASGQGQAEGQGGAGGSGATPAPPAAAAGNPAAFDAGMRRVDQAIAQRRWTRDDAAALGRTLDTVSPDQRAAILRTLIPAINRGEIKLAYRGEPF